MEKPVDPRGEYVKEIAWAILMIDVIIGLCALLVSRHVGMGTAARVCAGFAALVTVVFGGILLVNLILVWLYGRWERRWDGDQDRKRR
jgi:hypothetical protein